VARPRRRTGATATGQGALARPGSFKDVSLKDARFARDAARLQVRAGVDLVQEKRDAREEQKAAEAVKKATSFEECAQAYIDEHWSSWSAKHRAQWPSSLKRYAYPTIGRLTIAEIKPCAGKHRKSRHGCSYWLMRSPNWIMGLQSYHLSKRCRFRCAPNPSIQLSGQPMWRRLPPIAD
jgi:hypothetical protein